MRAPRDIIKHVCIEVAKGKRRCHRNREHAIVLGDRCIVVVDGAYKGSKNYCVACGLDILRAAEGKLALLRGDLGMAQQRFHP